MGHPTVEVTLLFTDIEGSTALAHELGDAYVDLLAQHNRIIRDAIGQFTGVEARNEGDAFFAAFDRAADAVNAALTAQRALADHEWLHGRPVRVRMGLHTGPVIRLLHDFAGLNVHLASRISAASHGGQVVASQAVLDALDGAGAFAWVALGDHIVKDFPAPITLYQLAADGLATAFPALNTIDARDHNLPAAVTSFIGRSDELADLRGLLSGEARLVTLTGPGGAGKTRLAVEAAWSVLSRYRGGAWFVDFAPVNDPEVVLDTICDVVGVQDRDQLVDRFAAAPTLLILDNLEQILSGVVVIGELLAACPKLVVLATTRERLRLQGEHEVGLGGLAKTDAVDLFAARAALVRRDFAPDGDVAELCARVEHLPLAIELAAARLRTETVDALVAAMDDMLATLVHGERDRPARHQALRAAIASSVDALTEAERSVFRAFAVFGGGATAEAVGAVCAPKADEIDSLVDKSLLRRSADRFAMLEPIRQFADERLRAEVPGDYEQRVEAHGRYYVALAERAEPELLTARQRVVLDELSAEHANFRLVWERGTGDMALRVAACLTRFWAYRGHVHEGRAVLARTLGAYPQAEPLVKAKALAGLGQLALLQADLVDARRALDEALAIAPDLLAGNVHLLLGEVDRVSGDASSATTHYDAALALARSSGDAALVARVMTSQGAVAFAAADYDVAAALWRDALETSRVIGDEQTAMRAGGNLGMALRSLGDSAGAIRAFEESLELARLAASRSAEAAARQNLAAAMFDDAAELGADALAVGADHVRAAIEIYEQLGYRRELAGALSSLPAFGGDQDEALRALARARSLFLVLRDDAAVAQVDALRAHFLEANPA